MGVFVDLKELIMSFTIQDFLVLLFVAVAIVYTIVRLRRVAAGQSKCVCGSKACNTALRPCESSTKNAAATGDPETDCP